MCSAMGRKAHTQHQLSPYLDPNFMCDLPHCHGFGNGKKSGPSLMFLYAQGCPPIGVHFDFVTGQKLLGALCCTGLLIDWHRAHIHLVFRPPEANHGGKHWWKGMCGHCRKPRLGQDSDGPLGLRIFRLQRERLDLPVIFK